MRIRPIKFGAGKMSTIAKIAGIMTCLELILCWYYNQQLLDEQNIKNDSYAQSGQNRNPDLQLDSLMKVSNTRTDSIAITDDHQFVAFVRNGDNLTVEDVRSNAVVYSAKEILPIDYLEWITDSSLFIGFKKTNATNGDLILKTLDVSSGGERVVHDFTGCTPVSSFQGITFSPYTNDVYALIGNRSITKMYRFDTMGYEHSVPTNAREISKPMMLSDGKSLFYEDSNHNIWEYKNNHSPQLFKTNSSLITVNNSVLYYAALNGQGKVESIYKYDSGKSSQMFTIKHPASPDAITIRKNGSALIRYGSSFYDTQVNKSYSVPNQSGMTMGSNGVFVTNNQGTYYVTGS